MGFARGIVTCLWSQASLSSSCFWNEIRALEKGVFAHVVSATSSVETIGFPPMVAAQAQEGGRPCSALSHDVAQS